MKKSTGIIRKVDELGRIVIPIEIRNQFNITEKDQMEIYVEGSNIILKKYELNCIFCGSNKDLQVYSEKPICEKCCENIKKTLWYKFLHNLDLTKVKRYCKID